MGQIKTKGSFDLSLKIKELPETERPYEKLELYGEKNLSNAELLAIIIKSGTKEETSVQIAQRILNLNYDPQMGELNFLKDITLEELMQINGIGRVKAIQLKAVCELAIRMSKPSNYKRVRIRSTEDLAKLVMEELKLEKKEYIKLFLLNNKNEIFNIEKCEGLSDFIREISEDQMENLEKARKYIKETSIPNLHIMQNGTIPPNPAELISSKNMKRLVNLLKNMYDIV